MNIGPSIDAGLVSTAMLGAPTGASLIGFTPSGAGAVQTTLATLLNDSFYNVFNTFTAAQVADVLAGTLTLDITSAFNQSIINASAASVPLIVPAGQYRTDGTINWGNGTSTTRSTQANCLTVIFVGAQTDITATGLLGGGGPGMTINGVVFQRVAASSTPTVPIFSVNGPIHGLNFIGIPVLNGASLSSTVCQIISASTSDFDGFGIINSANNGALLLLNTQQVTSIQGSTLGILTYACRFGKLTLFNPSATGAKCLSLDGFKSAGGNDVTECRFEQCALEYSGTGGIGLYLGYCDDIRFENVATTISGTSNGADAAIYLKGTNTPFRAPQNVVIDFFQPDTAVRMLVEDDSVSALPAASLQIRTLSLDGSAGANYPSGNGYKNYTNYQIVNDAVAGQATGNSAIKGGSDWQFQKVEVTNNKNGFYGIVGGTSPTYSFSMSRNTTTNDLLISAAAAIAFEGGATTGAQSGNTSFAVGGPGIAFFTQAAARALQAQVTGFGTPTGTGVINNFPGATATLAQCSQAIAQLIKDLKALGLYGA